MLSEFSAISLLNAILYAVLGLAVYALGLKVLASLAPAPLWKSIADDKNTALAVFAGLVALGAAVIIAAAVH